MYMYYYKKARKSDYCIKIQLIFAGDLISLISPLGTNRPK